MTVPEVPGPQESAILVPVPQAEPVVGHLRARLDRAAGRGVPAHVTVLYPFLPPAQITGTVLARAAAAVASVPTQVSHAWLMTGSQAPRSWQLRATFPLATQAT